MIGWYVHAHGRGHLQRLQCIAAHLRTPVTGLSSLPRPAGWAGAWVQLADDQPTGADRDPTASGDPTADGDPTAGGDPTADGDPTAGGDPTADGDPTAGGTLHWAPTHHPGLRDRMAAIAGWVADARPALVVVDVSVEVSVLVRALGVPVVVAAMRGERTDRAHRTAYDLADALLAPWPGSLPEPWPQAWLDKAWHVGALSRVDGRPVSPPPGDRRVAVLWGSGGSEVSLADVEAARAATPGWTWDISGLPGAPWLADPWPVLAGADVVVTHAGQNALAEVAAARRPAVVLPQERPHAEQAANARALARGGLALVRDRWPAAELWPALLDRAAAQDAAAWSRWSDGHGAERAAGLLDAAAARHREVSCAPQ